jgi:7tm Odorant receptor
MGMKEMDLDVSAILLPGKFFFQKLGLWFKSTTDISRWQQVLPVVIVFNTVLMIAMNISTMLGVREKSLAESTLDISFLLRQISVCQKMVILRYRKRDIGDLFSNAFEKISVPDLVSDVFEKYQNKCKKNPKLIFGVIVLTYITVLIYVISIVALAYFSTSQCTASSVLGGATVMPIWLPFDVNKYPLLKIIVLAYQLLGLQPIMVTVVGFFSFYSGALIIAEEMFKHLNDVLILLHKPVHRDPPFQYDLYVRQNQEVKDIIRYAVQHHIRSLK